MLLASLVCSLVPLHFKILLSRHGDWKERAFGLPVCVLQRAHPDQFRLDYALSREQNNRKGGKMYIQDKMEEYADEIFGLLDQVRIGYCMS